MTSQLAYISTCTTPDLSAEIEQILSTSRRNNAADDVTGVLLFAQGVFFQVLEGEASTVNRVFERIKGDPRHRDVTVLLDGEVPERRFAKWEMGWSQVPQDHPASETIARLGRRDAYAARADDSEIDALIASFFELNQT